MNKNIKVLIENTINFDVADYHDEESTMIDNQTIYNVLYRYFPKTTDELLQIILKKLKENNKEPDFSDIDISKINDILLTCLELKTYINIYNVEKLDLSTWKTSNIKDMSNMFYGCRSLKELNLSEWDVSNVTNMSYMFYGCISLRKLNLSGWKIAWNTLTNNMFFKCNKNILNVITSDQKIKALLNG